MAKFFTNFDEQPVGDVTTSGQTQWTPRISNGVSDYRIIDGGDADGKFLRISTGSTLGSRVLAFNPLNGIGDNIETLAKVWVFKSGNDGSTGRYGLTYTRYGGNSEASTIGYAVSFVPVSSVKSVALYEDSTGVVQYANYAWSMSTDYFVRTRISGGTRSVKIWPASSAEPTSWTFQSTVTHPTIADPYSGLGTYNSDSYLYVKQYSAGTNGDTAPATIEEYKQWQKDQIDAANNALPSSTPIVGFSGGYGGPAGGYGTALGLAKQNTTLVVNNATHDHIATSITLTQSHQLVIADAAHEHLATSPTITQAHSLTIANTTHGHVATSPAMKVNKTLVIQSAVHDLTSENLALVTGYAAVPNDTVHNLTSDNIVLQQHQTLVVEDASHEHVATSPVIIESKTLVIESTVHELTDSITKLDVTHYLSVDSTVHNLSSTSPEMVQSAILAIDNAVHQITSDTVDIIQFTLLGKPNDAVHGLKSDHISLSQEHRLTVDDALHQIRSDIIEKIFNWTAVGKYFGDYVPNWGSTGTLEQSDIDEGEYIPKYDTGGSFEQGSIESGEFAPNYIQQGKL